MTLLSSFTQHILLVNPCCSMRQYFILFMAESHFIVLIHQILFIHSYINGYLGCFHLLWTMLLCTFVYKYFINEASLVAQWSRICLPSRRRRCDPWGRKIPWRRKWQSIPVFLPGKAHGQRSLLTCSPWGHKRIGHYLATKQQQHFLNIEVKMRKYGKTER